MKLMELLPDPTDVLDPLELGDQEQQDGLDADRAYREKRERKLSPPKGSNVAKALQIRNLARMKAKAADTPSEDTPHQYNLGGHFTSFLDRGGHG